VTHAVNDEALDVLFRRARTYRKWKPNPVTPQMLMAVYDLMRLGPTSGNSCPARIAFVVSQEAKERLRPHLDAGNVRQTMEAPATAILAYDAKFYESWPKLRPTKPETGKEFRRKNEEREIERFAVRNASLQGGYFILAARAVGLDCGPMGGFNHAGVDAEFFDGTSWRSNFLCNLGYGEEPDLRPRAPRLDFDEACTIL
jgi:3-hydroxypropanoate dehydrogenase